MSYIRTKDGIYKLIEIRKNEYRMLNADGTVHLAHYEPEDYKIADTIEELCDEFVLYCPIDNSKTTYKSMYALNKGLKKRLYIKDSLSIYGIIHIEIKLPNGKSVFRLEPVAIMNEEGKLVLI